MDSGFSLWDPEVIGIIDLTANKKDCFGELMTRGVGLPERLLRKRKEKV